jgi:hypothetical protein
MAPRSLRQTLQRLDQCLRLATGAGLLSALIGIASNEIAVLIGRHLW